MNSNEQGRAIYRGLGNLKSPDYLVSINEHKSRGLENWGEMNGVMHESKGLGIEKL